MDNVEFHLYTVFNRILIEKLKVSPLDIRASFGEHEGEFKFKVSLSRDHRNDEAMKEKFARLTSWLTEAGLENKVRDAADKETQFEQRNFGPFSNIDKIVKALDEVFARKPGRDSSEKLRS